MSVLTLADLDRELTLRIVPLMDGSASIAEAWTSQLHVRRRL